MRVTGVIELDNNRYLVETNFSETEMQVIVGEGLKALIRNGVIPITQKADNTFEVHAPSSLEITNQPENPST